MQTYRVESVCAIKVHVHVQRHATNQILSLCNVFIPPKVTTPAKWPPSPLSLGTSIPFAMKPHLTSLLLLAALFHGVEVHAQHRCVHSEQREQMHLDHPEWMGGQEMRRLALEAHTQNQASPLNSCAEEDLVIPVVFHVVHDNGPENISDAQIHESIVQLNEDFSATNAELTDVHPNFQSLVADVGMSFRLADFDPNGQPTTGIQRIQSNLTYNGSNIALKQMVQWDPTMYLNIWVVHSSDGGNGSAFAFYPPDVEGSASIYDGIVSSYWAVGRTETAVWTHYKILTHEVGHWANLKHTWGDQSGNQSTAGCAFDDEVEDTPNTIGNTGCALEAASCGTPDNVQNYMDYSNCSSMFTTGQKARMLATMCSDVAGRNHIWSSENHAAVFLQDAFLPRIVYLQGSFEEDMANDGTLDSELGIALLDLTFSSTGLLVEGEDFTAENLPLGTSLTIEVTDATHATLHLAGQTANHSTADNVDDIEVHFTANPFLGVAYADIYNPSNPNLGLTFLDPYEIVFVDLVDDAHNFFEGRRWTWFTMGSGGANWGFFHHDLVNIKLETYGQGAVCHPSSRNIVPLPHGSLVGPASQITPPGTWYPEQLDLSNPAYSEWNGQTAYAGVQFERNGHDHYGWIRLSVSEDGRHYYAHDMAYHEEPYASIATGEVERPVLAYSQTTFHEAFANNGQLSSERTIDVFGASWSEFDTLENGLGFEVSNVPEGLSAQIQRLSDAQIALSFNGSAADHDDLNDLDVNVHFEASLLSETSDNMDLSQAMSIDWNDAYGIEYVEVDDSEGIAVANPGNNWKYFSWGVGDADFGLWYINDHFRLETYSKSGVTDVGSTHLAALQPGDTIQGSSPWEYYSELETQLVITSPNYGDWNGQTLFAGVKITIAERFHYGWMRLEVGLDGNSVKLIDYAYNRKPGEEILAGQTHATYGCTDPLALNFNPFALDDDGSCSYLSGCTDPVALNYNPEAIEDDGSCSYLSGCTDPVALNYNPEAIEDDGSCDYVMGCTDAEALNHDPEAQQDDGSCYFEDDILGCTASSALNYNPAATYDDGSCLFSNLDLADVAVEWCLGDTLWMTWTGGDPSGTVSMSLIDVTQNAVYASLGTSDNDGLHPWVVGNVETGPDAVYRLYIQAQPYPPTSWSYSNNFVVTDDCSSPCPADLDENGLVATGDLLLMLSDFGCSASCEADVNMDGDVSVEDLLMVLASFGNPCG